MNITYLVGNGFDMNLDLPTSYEEFIDYYCDKKGDNHIIESFKEDIKNNKKDWKDAELALGQSTKRFGEDANPCDSFRMCFQDIVEELASYLTDIQNDMPDSIFIEDTLVEFGKSLASFHEGLKSTDRDKIDSIINNIPKGYSFRVLNFNYTNIIDRLYALYEKSDQSVVLGKRIFQNTAYNNVFRSNIHVHGKTDGPMIFGVEHEGQIGRPELFDDDVLVKRLLIKSEMDSIIGEKAYEEANKYLSTSDIIYIYGLSLGETDYFWWKRIVQILKENPSVIVIIYWFELNNSKIKNAKIPYEKLTMIQEVKDKLFSYGSFDEETNKQLEERIFVTDSDIFDSFAKKIRGRMKGKDAVACN